MSHSIDESNEKPFLTIHTENYDLRRREFLRSCDIFNASIKKNLTDREIVFRDLDLCINSVCTLSCPHCVFSQPHIKSLSNFDPELVVSDLGKMLDAGVYTTSLAILGGEPLLHPQISEIIDRVAALERIDQCMRVIVITNGTIVPTEAFCESIKKLPNGSVIVNEFPKSNKVTEISEMLKANGVRYRVAHKDWRNHGSFSDDYNYSDTELKHLHYVCEAVSIIRNGHFSTCGRSLCAMQEELVPTYEEDFIDVRGFNGTVKDLNTALYDYSYRRYWLNTCKRCKGNHAKGEILQMGS